MIESRKSTLKSDLPPTEEIKFSTRAKVWTVAILVGLAVIFLLRVGEVLSPFLWAIITAFIFNGLLRTLTQRFGWKRWLGVTLVFGLFFILLGVGLLFLIPAISNEAKILAKDIPGLKRSVDDYLDKNPNIIILGFEANSETVRNLINTGLDRLPEVAQEFGPKLVTGSFHFLLDLLLYLITTFYLMLMGGRAIWRFVSTLPLAFRGEIRGLFVRADNVLGAYIKGQILLVLIMSAASFIALSILGIRYSLLLAIMVGILELIPFVGPYLAISICCVVAYFQPHGPGLSFGMEALTLVIVVGVVLMVLRQLEDLVVIPNIIGKLVELAPLLVIFSTITAAALMGPKGLLLGVPIVAVLKIIVGYLYYKLVDADRQKLFISPDTEFEELKGKLLEYPPDSRLLIISEPVAESLIEPASLTEMQDMSLTRRLDLAFYIGEEEKAAHTLREAGFPIVSLSQEHFLSDTGR